MGRDAEWLAEALNQIVARRPGRCGRIQGATNRVAFGGTDPDHKRVLVVGPGQDENPGIRIGVFDDPAHRERDEGRNV